ncbi:MAG: ATP-binding protein [Elusimicrobiota bacterium]
MGFAKERPADVPDPLLDPLLQRLAFLETVNDGLKSRLSARSFNADIHHAALRDQLENARNELSRQQQALEGFYREILAAGQERDRARSEAAESVKAREAAAQERDALRGRVETLEADLQRARRGALDPASLRLVADLEGKLEADRRRAQAVESKLLESLRTAESALRDAGRLGEVESAERLRALTIGFAERESALLKTIDESRRLLESTELSLETARRAAQESEQARIEAVRKADAETAAVRQALAKQIADREAPLLKIIENDRSLVETLKLELERARLGEREANRALEESDRKAQAKADERLEALARESAAREVSGQKERENERRRLAELTVELERTRRDAQQAEAALRESSRKSLAEAQAEAAESLRRLTTEFAVREALLLKAAEDDRRRLEASKLDLEQARRAANEAERALRDSAREALRDAKTQAEERLRTLTLEFAEREAQLLKAADNDRALPDALEHEIERTRRRERETARVYRESQEILERAAKADAAHRLRTLAKEFKEREAQLLKATESDRKLLEEMQVKLDAERTAAALARQEITELSAEAELSAVETAAEPFVSPTVEPVLDPGWARLLRLVRPPVESAYGHLRRLSATTLTAGQKALLRMAAASIASASDSLSSIELALEEGPAPRAPAPVGPVLESSLAAWEAAFRGRGVALVRDFTGRLPDAAHDPKELRIALHHVLRNVLEAVPRGGRLSVRAARGPDGGLRLEFTDDGPGFPPKWLESRFEPFASPRRGRAGLGLSIVRRTLRRWGGDAEASAAPSGRGARLTLLFAPPPPPGPAAK